MLLLIIFLIGFILAVIGLVIPPRGRLFELGVLLALLAVGLRVFLGISA